MGFKVGSSDIIDGVRVAAWQGIADTGRTIWDQDSSPEVSVRINTQRSDLRVAPEAMFCDLTLKGFDTNTLPEGRYDRSYHDKYVWWDYGEGYTFSSPTNVLSLDAADGGARTNSRYSRGPLGSHVFRTPGMYTVRVAVLEPPSGKWGYASATVTVGDPDTFYAGTATLFVDTTGVYANAPAGAQTFTSIGSAFTALDNAITPHRIVLERDQTHTVTSLLLFRPPSHANGVSLRLEARPGVGRKPIITPSVGFSSEILIYDNSLRDTKGIDSGTVFVGIEFQGLWDVSNETGTQINCLNFPDEGAANVVIDNCEFSNWGLTLYLNGRTPNRLIALNDLSISDWGDYGMLDNSQSLVAIMGCGIIQNPNAQAGGPKDDRHNAHGPLRIAEPTKTNIWACDLFSSTGWSNYNSIRAVQAALRWNTSASVTGAKLNLHGCALESAYMALLVQAQNTGNPRDLVNALVEGNILVAGFQARSVIEACYGGTTARNNTLIFANTTHDSRPIGGLNLQKYGFFYLQGGASGNLDNETTPIRLYNNTLINLTEAVAPVFSDAIGFRLVTEANNLVHEPSIGTPNTPYAPLIEVPAFSCRYIGYRDEKTPFDETYATPVDSAALWVPQLGSSALGAALAQPDASVDFRGELRPEPPSIGALEAD